MRNGNLRLLNAEWRGLKSSDVVNHSRCVRLKRGQAKLLSNIIERALKHGHVDMAREGERILKDNLTFPLQSLEIDEWKQFFQRILTDATECNPPQVTYASYYLGILQSTLLLVEVEL